MEHTALSVSALRIAYPMQKKRLKKKTIYLSETLTLNAYLFFIIVAH